MKHKNLTYFWSPSNPSIKRPETVKIGDTTNLTGRSKKYKTYSSEGYFLFFSFRFSEKNLKRKFNSFRVKEKNGGKEWYYYSKEIEAFIKSNIKETSRIAKKLNFHLEYCSKEINDYIQKGEDNMDIEEMYEFLKNNRSQEEADKFAGQYVEFNKYKDFNKLNNEVLAKKQKNKINYHNFDKLEFNEFVDNLEDIIRKHLNPGRKFYSLASSKRRPKYNESKNATNIYKFFNKDMKERVRLSTASFSKAASQLVNKGLIEIVKVYPGTSTTYKVS